MSIEQKLPAYVWLKRGTLAFIGFVLSPLSWWNDVIINIPLAYGFAWVIARSIHIFFGVHRYLFVSLFVCGYFLTNLAGFLMIHYSLSPANGKKDHPIKQILVSLLYTLIIVGLSYFDIFHLRISLDILPSWVIK